VSAVVNSVASVQVAQARKVVIAGRSILTAIHKTAVVGPVEVKPLGLQGDEQADLSVHGGLEKAVYAYPAEHYAFWVEARRAAGVAAIDPALPYGSIG
jgi:MOSC domain-containing protein YiiM